MAQFTANEINYSTDSGACETSDKAEKICSNDEKRPVIFLFDVDGTLTMPRLFVTPEMLKFLYDLRKRVPIAVVGGSNLEKIFEQLVPQNIDVNRDEILTLFDFIFAENGLTGYEGTNPLPVASISKELGEQKCQKLTNYVLRYMSELELPFKRGTFVEHRNGMINISPCGRSCTQAERLEFVNYERDNPVRKKFVDALRKEFPADTHGLTFSIGGQISIDIFPSGWDKTYCLRYLMPKYEKIHFFGDKTTEGGNDYEIFLHPATIGHTVFNPKDCRLKVLETLNQLGL